MAKIINVNMTPVDGRYNVVIETSDNTQDVVQVAHSLITDMKAEYQKAHLQDTRLEDKTLISIAALWDDPKMGDLLADMDAQDPPQEIESKSKVSISATGRDNVSIRVGQLLASSAEVVKDLQEWINLGVQRKRLPASIAFHMSGVWSKEIRADMPEPGSIQPENYKGQMLFDKKDDKPGTESWYLGVAEDFPGYWENYGTPLRELSECLKKDSTARNRYSSLKPYKQEDLRNTLLGQRKALVDIIKQCVTVLNMMDDVHEHTSLKVFFRVTNNEVERTMTPIRVLFYDERKDKTDPDYFYEKYMSVGAFLKVDIGKVAKLPAHEQFEAFKAERAEPEDEDDQGIARITNTDEFERVIGWLASMNTGRRPNWDNEVKQIEAGFIRHLKAPPSESDPLLALAFKAKEFLDIILSDAKFSSRYRKMTDDMQEEPAGDKKVA